MKLKLALKHIGLPVLIASGLLTAGGSFAATSQTTNQSETTSQPETAAAEQPAKPSFEQYTAALRQEAEQKGYDKALLDDVFSSLTFHERVVKADQS